MAAENVGMEHAVRKHAKVYKMNQSQLDLENLIGHMGPIYEPSYDSPIEDIFVVACSPKTRLNNSLDEVIQEYKSEMYGRVIRL